MNVYEIRRCYGIRIRFRIALRVIDSRLNAVGFEPKRLSVLKPDSANLCIITGAAPVTERINTKCARFRFSFRSFRQGGAGEKSEQEHRGPECTQTCSYLTAW